MKISVPLDFSLHTDSGSGALYISSKLTPISIYCTPYWEDSAGIEISTEAGGNPLYSETLEFPGGNIHTWDVDIKQQELFQKVMTENLPRILELATKAYWEQLNPKR